MAEINLKEYTSRAKELEAAIYTQKRLMQQHREVLKAQHPVPPERRIIPTPLKPDPKKYHIEYHTTTWFPIAMLYFLGTVSLMMCFLASFWWIVGVLGGVFAIFWTKDEIHLHKSAEAENERLAQEYKKAEKEYARQLQERNNQRTLANEEYERAQEKYQVEVLQYEDSRNTAIQKHNSTLSALEKALQELYGEDVIFSKYRNLVAITAINEYLLSGRCYSLEGADGAYNLYEMELRQNIVIGQLSNIISNLEQIRSNQYSLYEQLTRSNALVENIIRELRDIRSDTQLTAYFAEVAALAEISPKFYIGTTI